MFPFFFPSASRLSTLVRSAASSENGPTLPVTAVLNSPSVPNTNTAAAPVAGQAGPSTPAATSPMPPAVIPAALAAQPIITDSAMLRIVGKPNAHDGAQASQERCRLRAVTAFAQVLDLRPNQVDSHVPSGVTPIKSILSAILTAENRPIPDPAGMLKLIHEFIDVINHRACPPQALPPSAPVAVSPNNAPSTSGAAAALSSQMGAAGIAVLPAPRFKAPQQPRLPAGTARQAVLLTTAPPGFPEFAVFSANG
ncbi:MAG: hypothetical protein ACRC9T_07040, partial [Vibrionaceae bacterium]